MKSRLVVMVALAVGLPALAFAAGMNMGGGDSEVGKALMAVNDRMMKAMTITPSGNADRDFVSMMIPHHQGAIEMAKVELQYGTDPAIRQLAEAIVAAQEKEIAEMQAWLAAHPH